MSEFDNDVPELKRQDHIYLVLPHLETVSDVEREEEFDMLLDKLIREQQGRNRTCETGYKNVENNK